MAKRRSHNILALEQWISKWSIVSSFSSHKQHLFTRGIPFLFSWSKVSTLPQEASQAKNPNLEGTIGFQMDHQGMSVGRVYLSLRYIRLTEKPIVLDSFNNSLRYIRVVENVEQLAHELGCKVGALPSTYLGLPLGARHHAVCVWEGVEERFQKRLASWKRQYISKGGKLTLIRSTLSNLPIYLLSLFRLPKSVKGGLERNQRFFFGGWLKGKFT